MVCRQREYQSEEVNSGSRIPLTVALRPAIRAALERVVPPGTTANRNQVDMIDWATDTFTGIPI